MSDTVVVKTPDTNGKQEMALTHDEVQPMSASEKAKNKIMSRFCLSTDDDPLIQFNVGGTPMTTRRSTLIRIPNTVLALLCISPWSETFARDADGRLFLDCDPVSFQDLLNQLRTWSPTRKVFDLPKDRQARERFRALCRQLHFDLDLTEGIQRHDKFNKICGHMVLDEKGLAVRHVGSYRHAECRGMNVYAAGIHRITLTIRYQAMDKYSTFIGIIWSASPMQEKSFESPTAYGWGGQSQVFLKGQPVAIQGFGGYDSDICTNDSVEITLNCQLSLISLLNHRTKKVYEIPVDTQEGCPLPWQLHINLYGSDDRVRIISPT